MPAYIQDQRTHHNGQNGQNGWGESHGGGRQDSYQPAQQYQQPYSNYPQTQSQPQPQPPYQQEQRMGDPFQSQHQLGATFYPGGQDDFYMPPEVISPLPQRIMPELEQNVEGGLARLELEAQNSRRNRVDSMSTIASPQASTRYDELGLPVTSGYSNPQQRPLPPSLAPSFAPSIDSTSMRPKTRTYEGMREEYIQKQAARNMSDSPKFSPFPKPEPGPNIPLSDDDEEELLERMRPVVLPSNDPEMQLGWSYDALAWVETASSHALRQQDGGQPARSITPKVEHQLRVDALSIVQFLGEQHHPKAEFMMGMWLEFGKFGYRVDKKEAFLSYRRAAEKQYARAEYRIGMQYEGSNNAPKAIEHYKKGVQLKDSASNYRLGMMTLLGQHGVTQDYRRGIELIRYAARGADKNAPQGAYVYGMLLARELPNIDIPDQFLPDDINEARLFIEKAAKLGFAKAQLKMAQAYELCLLDVKFDPALSLHYNALASRQGEADADMAISKWFLCGYERLFEKNEELAFTYAKRAAGTKMPTAEFALGYFYEIGIHVPRDLRESEMWYRLAADHGSKDALSRIDSIKKNSTLTKKDHEKVAINRIKSQYGSKHGQRPERFKEKPPPMPSMSEESLDMPDPRNKYNGIGQERREPQIPQVSLPPVQNRPPVINHPLPPRPVSTAPYPEDDAPPRFNPVNQPKKSAPYPLQDIGGPGLRPNPRPGPHADRPSSAFGIRPLVQTDSFGPQGRGDPRPSTSMANMQPSGGRGQPPPGRGGFESKLPAKYHLDSLPSQQRQPTLPRVDMGPPARPGTTDYGAPNRQQTGSVNVNKPQPPRPANEGFPSGSGRPSSSSGQGQRPTSSHGAGGDPAHRRTNSGNQPVNQFVRPDRGSSITSSVPPLKTQTPTSARPERLDSMQTPVSAASASRASNRPPPSHTMSSQSQNTNPSPVPSPAPSVAPSTSSTPAGPKKTGGKTGPATFEEMGIPQGKSDSECIVM